MAFTKATKKQSKLRLALFGPSGSGKTFTALRVAKGMGGKIALIDTEYGSASKYADRFDFDTVSVQHPDIDTLVGMFADGAGYNVLIVDSLSHAWQELLEEIDKLANAKYRGNTWSAWSEGTPKQKSLVRAILSFPGHIIVTMRSKTEWTTGDDGKGKSRPVRVGLAPEQGKGIEYEFDMLMELSTEHVANVIKDRTGKYQDKIIDKPDEAFGKSLIEWLSTGEPDDTAQVDSIRARAKVRLAKVAADMPKEAKIQLWGEIVVLDGDEVAINAKIDKLENKPVTHPEPFVDDVPGLPDLAAGAENIGDIF